MIFSNTKKGVLFMLLATIGFSIIPVLASIGFTLDLSAAALLFYRFLMAALFFLAYCFVKKKSLKLESTKFYIVVILAGIIYAIQCLLFFSAFRYISPSLGEILYHCYPLFILVLAAIVLKERITTQKIIGVILSIAGVAITLFAPWNITEIRGIIFVVMTAFISSIYMVFTKKYTSTIDTTVLTTYLCFVCASVFLGYILIFGEFVWINTWKEFLNAGLLAFWSTIIGLFAFMKAISYLDIGLVSILSLSEPIFTILLSYIILGTTLTMLQIIGTTIILIAIYIYEIGIGKKIITETVLDTVE